MDTKDTYNPLEGAKLNALGQPVKADGITPIDPIEYGKFPFGTIDALFGTSARKERELADYQSALKDPKGLTGLVNKEVSDLKAVNNPGFLKRVTNNLTDFGIAVGVGALTTPIGGAAAGMASKENRVNQSIAGAKVTQMVLEKQKGVDPSKINDLYRNTATDPYTPAEKAWKRINDAIEGVKKSAGFAPKVFDELFAPNIQKAYDGRLNLARTKWAVQDFSPNAKNRETWSVAPDDDTYKKYVNIGRQSEKITAKGQVMRTQADAYNQNRADDQSAASERAGRRAAAINNRPAGQSREEARDQFNRENADDIRTKYGGNKQTDSNGEDSGGTHCCTAAQARGDMTITEVKKLRAWHREQDMFWQEGYDVWGKVIADNLVAKSKWQSDRVRDFYDHKIYGKRTIGSIYADVVIYPMSYIIGAYKVLKNTLKIKGTNYGN